MQEISIKIQKFDYFIDHYQLTLISVLKKLHYLSFSYKNIETQESLVTVHGNLASWRQI